MVLKAYHRIRGNAVAFCQQPHPGSADVQYKSKLLVLIFELVNELQPSQQLDASLTVNSCNQSLLGMSER